MPPMEIRPLAAGDVDAVARVWTHQKNSKARAFYEKWGLTAVRFGMSPPPESEPDVEYQWRPAR